MFSNWRKSRKQARNRKVWRDALMSGDYVQGDGALVTYDEVATWHCCLGVAAEAVLGLKPEYPEDPSEHIIESGLGVQGFYFGEVDHEIDMFTWPSDLFNDTFGIAADEADANAQFQFTRANDLEGKSFPEIAEMIPK